MSTSKDEEVETQIKEMLEQEKIKVSLLLTNLDRTKEKWGIRKTKVYWLSKFKWNHSRF